ncbi:adenylyltransferase/cytidyltransferase family protein [Patescibacteria group bacterium]|nr:adenylyltransferase/cytidyltransferase family protein [Patescibacteria group bacterium]
MSKKTVEKKIMVFGTFDGLHLGHINFFKQAKNLTKNSFLIVSIARDKNVLRIKGKYPDKNEQDRITLVKKCKLVDQVVLSGIKNHLPHIVKMCPDIIALGYDQKAYVHNLKKDLKNKGILIKIMRLRPFKRAVYKNHLLKKRR